MAGKTVFRGQSGGNHRNVKGAFRTPVTSLMKGPGTRKERETGVKECLGLRGEDSAHCQYIIVLEVPVSWKTPERRMRKKYIVFR